MSLHVIQKLIYTAINCKTCQRHYNKFRAGVALIPLSADPDGVQTASGRLLVGPEIMDHEHITHHLS